MTRTNRLGGVFQAAFLMILLIGLNGCQPIRTVDLPGSELDVKVTVVDTDQNPADLKVPIFVQFFSGGKYVKLASNATVTCDGINLTYRGLLGYGERVPMQPTGGAGSYNIAHHRNGITTPASVSVPARPHVTQPAPHASVPRTTSLTINYVPSTGSGVMATASPPGKTGNVQPDTGTYTGFDVSNMTAGAGTIGILREYTGTILFSGFRTAEKKYTIGGHINIVWE